jgi:predicted dehydrogenase
MRQFISPTDRNRGRETTSREGAVMAERATVAVIGCGGVASYAHLPALARMDNVRIVGLCDIDLDKAVAKCECYRAKPYSDYHKMLDELRPQRVHVLTPDSIHVEPALAALAAGADVLVEKPLATSVDDCRKLVEAAGQRLLGVGYNYRFIPVMQQARQVIADGAIGDLIGLTCFCHNFCWHHCLDLARWLAGPIVRVRAEEGRKWSERPDAPFQAVPGHHPTVMGGFPMIAAVQLEHSHGAISQIVTTSQMDLADVMFEMRLIGTDGWLRIDQVAIEDVVGRLRKFSAPAGYEKQNMPAESHGELVEFFPSTSGGFATSFDASIRAFHQAADARTAAPVSATHAMEIVAIEEAARLSAEEARAVVPGEIN